MSVRQRQEIQTLPRKERVKIIDLLKKIINGRVYASGHLFFLVLTLTALCSCSPEQTHDTRCNNKVSASLQSILSDPIQDTVRISVTVILTDSGGITGLFPALSVQNANVALGHLTKEEISSLCKLQNVQYIDIPKIRFPNK